MRDLSSFYVDCKVGCAARCRIYNLQSCVHGTVFFVSKSFKKKAQNDGSSHVTLSYTLTLESFRPVMIALPCAALSAPICRLTPKLHHCAAQRITHGATKRSSPRFVSLATSRSSTYTTMMTTFPRSTRLNSHGSA